jgi:hypothetical protein
MLRAFEVPGVAYWPDGHEASTPSLAELIKYGKTAEDVMAVMTAYAKKKNAKKS